MGDHTAQYHHGDPWWMMWFHVSEQPFALEKVQQIVHNYLGISPGDINCWVGTTLGHPSLESPHKRNWTLLALWPSLSESVYSFPHLAGCDQSSGSCYTIKAPRWCQTVGSQQNKLIVFNYIIRTWLNGLNVFGNRFVVLAHSRLHYKQQLLTITIVTFKYDEVWMNN